MLKVSEINFNIQSNKIIRIKTDGNIIQQDLRNSKILLKILTFVTLINSSLKNQQYAKLGEKKIEMKRIKVFFLLFTQEILYLKKEIMS